MARPSTYLRLRQRLGHPIPFPPPLPSPKHTGGLSPRQWAHWWLWRGALSLTGQNLARLTPRPLFLVGCHNSGTTVLARLIGQHPAIVNWSEAPEVWTPDDAFLSWGVLPHSPHPLPFLFDPHAYTRTVAQHSSALPSIRQHFALFALLRGRRRFLNKNPHMTLSVPYMRAAFPQAGFIFLHRNGYAVVQSLLSNWRPLLEAVAQGREPAWAALRTALPPDYFTDPAALVRQCARYWRNLEEGASADLALLPPQQVYSTTYERLCIEPETVLREIFAQFGLTPQRYNWRQFHRPTRYPWNEMLPMENRNFKYRERLTAQELALITQEAGATLQALGYALEN